MYSERNCHKVTVNIPRIPRVVVVMGGPFPTVKLYDCNLHRLGIT